MFGDYEFLRIDSINVPLFKWQWSRVSCVLLENAERLTCSCKHDQCFLHSSLVSGETVWLSSHNKAMQWYIDN